MTETESPEVSPEQPTSVAAAVRELERELRSQRLRRWTRRVVLVGVVLALGLGIVAFREFTRPEPVPRFTTRPVQRRDIIEKVQSTGTVKPLTEVVVGAQVSGRVVKVYVDFNSVVKQGDLLAEIDPSLFGAQVSQTSAQLKAAKANVTRAEARLSASKLALDRAQRLAKERVGTQAQVDQAQGDFDVAQADVFAAKAQISQLKAQLASARTTLGYTKIFSPIDGIVIKRAVDSGQTVAASFAAPELFVIAEDLKKMQVLASIDEADVGKLEQGMAAEVVVDAFPGKRFKGKVTQIRFSPTDVQGVVTYPAVIDVENPELKLRPGMTATVTIVADEARNVVAVQNAALRFRPLPAKDAASDEEEKPAKPEKPPPPLKPGFGRVYLIASGPPEKAELMPKLVRLGITDGLWTEVRDKSLTAGTQVVTEQRPDPSKRGFSLF